MPHIFISYSRQDIDFARYVRSQLEHQGFSVWMDEKRLSAGEDWFDSIITAVDKCVAFVAIMSPEAQKSHWVRSEILRALDQNKPTFPILLSGKVFPLLAALQYEDMRKGLNDTLSFTLLDNLRRATGISDTRQILFEIVEGDVTKFECDVLVFKHAGTYLGADAMVASRLRKKGIPMEDLSDTLREHGDFFYIPTDKAIPAKNILYIRTKNTGAFYYRDVREFSASAMNTLADEAPDTQHMATTVHGIRTQRQLDEGESILAQIAGFIEQFQNWDAPPALSRITIVERDADRVLRLRNAVQDFFEEVTYATPRDDAEWGYDLLFTRNVAEATPEAGTSDEKPYALTMMLDDDTLEDLFFYGIQRPVHAMGLLCERVNPVHQVPDSGNETYVKSPVLSILERIRYAQALIVDATDMTDLMHLYVGFAWGADVPVYLISRREQLLEFAEDVLISDKIWQVEERLSQWFKNLDG